MARSNKNAIKEVMKTSEMRLTLKEMIDSLPDPLLERLEPKLRQEIAELLDEWRWEQLFEQAKQKGLFDEMVKEVKDQIERREVSDLSELLS